MVLPTEFRKSLLVQLIPGLCVELYNYDDVPDELEQHFKDVPAHRPLQKREGTGASFLY